MGKNLILIMINKNFTITAQCLIKDEERFIGYSIRSVIDYVDKVLIFDTGSTDKTVEIIQDLIKEYPNKIIFERKGECDKVKLQHYKQEMLEKTKTDWFMILDGDEVWTKAGIEEAMQTIQENKKNIDCVGADIYLCMGDIFHDHNRKLVAKINGIKQLTMTRFCKIIPGMRWRWVDQSSDGFIFMGDKVIWNNPERVIILKNKFWHMTNLCRSSVGDDIHSSNTLSATRGSKVRSTYFLVGKKIKENVPEVFDENFKNYDRLDFLRSFLNFWPFLMMQIKKKYLEYR